MIRQTSDYGTDGLSRQVPLYQQAVQYSTLSRSGTDTGMLSFDPTNFPSLSASTGRTSISQPIANLRENTTEEFTIQKENFPALPRASTSKQPDQQFSVAGLPSDRLAQLRELHGVSSLSTIGTDSLINQSSGSSTGGIGGGRSIVAGNTGSMSLLSGGSVSVGGAVGNRNNNNISNEMPTMDGFSALANLSASSSVGSSSAGAGAAGGAIAMTKEAKFGLTGLLDIIRHADRDSNILALGSDLTTFGLNLNSTECLFSTFSSPFADQPMSLDPVYTTPACYMMQPPSLKPENVSKFQMETLFYMFYSMPRDVLQAVAAQELYRREWRYHSELRLWLKPRTPQELLQSHPGVQFLYFDVNAWEARLFTSNFRGNISAGLLTDDEIRGKTQTQHQQLSPQPQQQP